MCWEHEFDPDEVVLHHRSVNPAVTISHDPSREELAFDWTLSDKDIGLVFTHRGSLNLCRFAVQLCVLRKHGRFLSDYARVPPAILGYLCRQLDLTPMVSLAGHSRRITEPAYQREILEYLGWKPFDDDAGNQLQRWIHDQVSTHLYVDNLVENAEAFLRENHIVIPGPVAFERVVNSAYRQAEAIVFQRITAQIPEEIKVAIDRLLTVFDASGKTDFFRFAEYPPEAKAKHIVRQLHRYEELAGLGLDTFRFADINPDLMRKLAKVVKTYDAWQIKRFEEQKRYALAACFLYEARKTILDDLVEMHAQFLITMERKSRNAWDAAHRKLRKRVRLGISTLTDLAEQVLALGDNQDVSLHHLLNQVDIHEIRTAVQDCGAFEQLEQHGFLEQLHARYNNFRRYFRYFVTLNFQCESGSRHILEAIDLVCRLDAGDLKRLPPDVNVSFVPGAWRKTLYTEASGIHRKTWEIALALALRDALRSGDVYLPDSRKHVSFWNLCYDDPAWNQKRPAAYHQMDLSMDAGAAMRKLTREFNETAGNTATNLSINPFVNIVDQTIQVRREPALVEPQETAALRQFVERDMSTVRIEQLLMEVDGLCGFSHALKPPGYEAAEAGSSYQALMATLVAHGTQLGIATMADSTEGLTVDMLQRVSRTCLREDTLRSANALLVNYHHGLDTSRFWGEGVMSSSDGQRFGVQKSSLLSAFYPRYFGYYDRAVTVYTHVSDQLSVFNTQVISCAEREALYVLDGLLEHGTGLDIEEHVTDTHGFTEQIFGLCYLLGFSFMPRIRDFKTQQLYKPGGGNRYGAIDPLFIGTIDVELIKEQWDALVRVAASLKNRIVSAHVIAQRLARLGSSNRLAKALTHLGRWVKTIYLLRYIDDPVLRRRVAVQLNRGEMRHQLARYVAFANQGEFRSGNYFEIMNKASCLSLISNAILVFNTLHIERILDRAKEAGQAFSSEAIARVLPLHHRHIVVNGTYDFSQRETPKLVG